MALVPSVERPLSLEEKGVVGEGAVHSDEVLPVTEADVRPASATVDPSAAALGAFAADFDKAEDPDDPQEQQLPDGFEDWQAYKLANGSAREQFTSVVLFPGHEFVAAGRYVDAKNVSRVFDVEARHIIPRGLYLFPANYLVGSPLRDRILRGEVAPQSAPKQPNPLRSKDKE